MAKINEQGEEYEVSTNKCCPNSENNVLIIFGKLLVFINL